MSKVVEPLPESLLESSLQPVQAVAKYLSLSRSKVYQLMDQGKLRYVKIGKSRRIRWADVMKLVDDNVVGGSN